MLKFKVNLYQRTIETVEVERETPNFVVLADGARERKSTDWSRYFDTFKEAKTFTALALGKAIAHTRGQMILLNTQLADLNSQESPPCNDNK